jgi:hypothetical protein
MKLANRKFLPCKWGIKTWQTRSDCGIFADAPRCVLDDRQRHLDRLEAMYDRVISDR